MIFMCEHSNIFWFISYEVSISSVLYVEFIVEFEEIIAW